MDVGMRSSGQMSLKGNYLDTRTEEMFRTSQIQHSRKRTLNQLWSLMVETCGREMLCCSRTWLARHHTVQHELMQGDCGTCEAICKNKVRPGGARRGQERPSQSPDLNPTEVKQAVLARKPSNIAQMREFCIEAKVKPSSDWHSRLVDAGGGLAAATGMWSVQTFSQKTHFSCKTRKACLQQPKWCYLSTIQLN